MVPRNDVDDLLNEVRSNLQQKVASREVAWEDTVIQLPGRAIFDIEHQRNAQYTFTWLDAIAAVQAVTAKMLKDGYYERSAAILMNNKVLVAEMGLYKEAQRRMSNVTASPDDDENDIHLRYTHWGRSINWRYIQGLLEVAIESARFNIAIGKGEDVVTWTELRWYGSGITISMWPNLTATHHMTWEITLDVLQLFLAQMSSTRWRELDADIIWKQAGEGE
ncbi:MAG: hypothetical protein Q9191_003337 [Dirinaria sp. TL-2023a]